jgi:putative hydrolase of the HAD superfamily
VTRYDAVLLDAYGTLVELDRPYERLRRSLRARLGADLGPADVERAMRAEMDYYADNCHRGSDEEALRALRADCAAVLLRELGLEHEPRAAAESLIEAIRFRVFEDVPPTLEGLRRAGVAVAVVSNWDCSLPAVLREAGLELEHVVASASAGASKPDPAIFRRALAQLGVDPARAVHVGDTPGADGDGARAAGVAVRILDRSRPSANGRIGALTEILELMR